MGEPQEVHRGKVIPHLSKTDTLYVARRLPMTRLYSICSSWGIQSYISHKSIDSSMHIQTIIDLVER